MLRRWLSTLGDLCCLRSFSTFSRYASVSLNRASFLSCQAPSIDRPTPTSQASCIPFAGTTAEDCSLQLGATASIIVTSTSRSACRLNGCKISPSTERATSTYVVWILCSWKAIDRAGHTPNACRTATAKQSSHSKQVRTALKFVAHQSCEAVRGGLTAKAEAEEAGTMMRNMLVSLLCCEGW